MLIISECYFQVIDMPEHNPGQLGGTMRLGKRSILLSLCIAQDDVDNP